MSYWQIETSLSQQYSKADIIIPNLQVVAKLRHRDNVIWPQLCSESVEAGKGIEKVSNISPVVIFKKNLSKCRKLWPAVG